jgi:hypothetical protein
MNAARTTSVIFQWLAITLLIGHFLLPFGMSGGIGPWTPISSFSFFQDMADWPLGIIFSSAILLAAGGVLSRPFMSASLFKRLYRGMFWIEVLGIISLILILVLVVNLSPMIGSLALLLAFVSSLLTFGKQT